MNLTGSTTDRRTFLAAIGATAAAAVIAACSSDSDSASPEASASSWGVPATDPTATLNVLSNNDEKHYAASIAAFKKAHPTIGLNWQVVPGPQFNATLDQRIASKTGDPDVYWADQPRIAALASRGEAQDLTDVFAKYKPIFDPTAYNAGIYDDRLWALPIENSTQLMYYNKQHLSKAGIAFPSADIDKRMTWDQLTRDAAKAKAAGAKHGFMFDQPAAYYQLEVLPVQLGGSVGAVGPHNLTPDITGPAWIQALDWYGSLFASGVSPRGIPAERADPTMLAGDFAYMVGGQWLLSELETTDLKWGVAPQPVFSGGKPATPTGSWSVGMNPFSQQKDAGAVWLKFMAIDGGGSEPLYSPGSLGATTEGKKVYFSGDVFKTPNGKQAAKIIAYETSKTSVNRVSTIGYLEFEAIMTDTYNDIINGDDAKTALGRGQTQIQTAWKKYQ